MWKILFFFSPSIFNNLLGPAPKISLFFLDRVSSIPLQSCFMLSSFAFSHSIVCGDHEHLDIPHNVTLTHYIDGITQVESDEQEGASTTNMLVKLGTWKE